ncbi:O-antigen ligase family protein [Flavobacterium psychrophilum]|uniref:O-antigen ligase family protein n=1 Tax=Flavobacterium psychrophilum TaxID=96345 RepID=UPI000B7C157A|nr:O-antigen ligase family protein [Flavobacterium psychrophilum]MCB5984004.1 O-antigen ligase family protein [Flavobacterium psychrophilum]MCB5993728.1 O-antigen ligase family protein [Flavobacterium psychrophilum]MCB5996215.1 O-antigen ligase family protein [Flavobacterium psychrophilum]MCB6003407.1 O-antigen ligase family protein [Flavobacterium psychrophilum]MCB6006134.1 O-antigen ligase family protein [Flavobacterium psychrophilum]
MKSKNLSYTTIILLHIGLGILIYMASKLSIPYGLAILSVGLLTILKTQNTKNQVLYFCAYIVGSEVILRMTGGSLSYEIGKYSVILFMLMGIYFSGFSRNSFLYWIFLILLLPGVLLATVTLKLDTDIQKSIAFNISGPVCLGISALYCYQRKITLKELDNILFCMLCPIITTVTYMFLYTPSVKKIITSTQSNFETSGGFGPNQVSTIVGLGVFIMFSRLVFHSKNKQIIVLSTTLLLIMAFRGIITFSRGGMLSSAVMIALLLLILFFVTQRAAKIKLFWMVVFSFVAFLIIWSYSSSQTNGLIAKRYANEDASGRVKSTLLSGREEIIGSEFDMFLANPIFGIGVGKGRENRLESTGESIASHNEISRMLAEHGSLGALGIVILFVTPLVLYTNNRRHIYLLSFFAFWILTINHAAMRLAAPAFVYALSLLHIYSIEDQNKLNENIE